jgi:hypothetical protein
MSFKHCSNDYKRNTIPTPPYDIPSITPVGRRGTNQLHLLERYLDVLVKHTTEIPPPTALVEDVSVR